MNKLIHYIKYQQDTTDFEEYCISTWSDKNPDFEIRKWTEDDPEIIEWVQGCKFAKSAISIGKPVFAVDYLRLKIIQNYGGCIMDTDVICARPLEELLLNYPYDVLIPMDNYSSTTTTWTNTGTFTYSKYPNNPLITELVNYYESLEEATESSTNEIIDHIIKSFLDLDELTNTLQINGEVAILPNNVLGGYLYEDGILLNDHAYVIHCNRSSWLPKYYGNLTYIYDNDISPQRLYSIIDKFLNEVTEPGMLWFVYTRPLDSKIFEMLEFFRNKAKSKGVSLASYLIGYHIDDELAEKNLASIIESRYSTIPKVRRISDETK